MPKKLNNDGLTLRQNKFLINYMSNGRCAKKAAIDAGYAPKSAAVSAHKNLRNPKIAAIIDAENTEYIKKCQASREKLAQQYDHAIDMAKDTNNIRALLAAIRGKARLFGFETNKLEHTGSIGIIDLIADKEE